MSLINTPVQPFKTQAFHNGKFIEVSDASLKGKWSVLIFMPAAFTFNSPNDNKQLHLFFGLPQAIRKLRRQFLHTSSKYWISFK